MIERGSEQEKGMRQICREIFGTDNIEDLRQIAKKAEAYDRLMKREHPMNIRNAGRREMFTDQDVDLMISLYQQGKTIQFLAEYFDTSRQTIYKYLAAEKRFQNDPFITMRMIFMYQNQECTVIDIDFKHQKIYIRNKTRDILHRAFGVVEEPTWEEFEEFLESRCFPRSRANMKQILRDIGVPCYDPLQIIEKTQGRMAEDLQWLNVIYKNPT